MGDHKKDVVGAYQISYIYLKMKEVNQIAKIIAPMKQFKQKQIIRQFALQVVNSGHKLR